MGRGSAGSASRAAGSKASSGTPVPLSSREFASAAIAAARRVGPAGRFGDNKVFIADAHVEFSKTPEGKGTTLDAFKKRLTEANNARHLDLSGANLVEAMNPVQVARSEAAFHGATFHFIRIPVK